MPRSLSLFVLSLTAFAVSGCASVWSGTTRSYSESPSGLPWGEELVRRALVMGTFDQALQRTAKGSDGAPNDAVLRALFQGQVAFYAGRWAESAAAFAEADRLTDDRYTKSASRSVLSMVTNDHALRYVPPRTERLFSRYYAMLGRVQSGDVEGAAVEARRLSALLEESGVDLDPSERATHAALRDVAGAVFESAAEWNDASVSYRNAALLRGTSRDSVDSIVVTRPAGDSATLLLVVESGFVAHYVAQSLAIPMEPMNERAARQARRVSRGVSSETLGRVFGVPEGARGNLPGSHDVSNEPKRTTIDRGPTSAPPDYVISPIDSVTRAKPSVTSRWLTALDALPDGGVFLTSVGVNELPGNIGAPNGVESVASDWTPRRIGGTRYLGDGRGLRSWMEVTWPALVRPRLPSAPASLRLLGVVPADSSDSTDGGASVDSSAIGDRSVTTEGTSRDGRWTRDVIIPAVSATSADISDAIGADARRGRLARLTRLTARTVTRAVAIDAVREKHGEAAGLLTSILASAIERADTRAWHLLPGRLSIVRVTVPAGQIEPSLLLGAGVNPTTTALSAFDARPGSVHVMSTRVWRDPVGASVPTISANQRHAEGTP